MKLKEMGGEKSETNRNWAQDYGWAQVLHALVGPANLIKRDPSASSRFLVKCTIIILSLTSSILSIHSYYLSNLSPPGTHGNHSCECLDRD